MLLVLEDNPDKLATLVQRYRDRIANNTMVVCDSVRQAQFVVESILKPETELELWLDDDLGSGGSGYGFLIWLLETVKLKFLLITTLSMRAKDKMEEVAKVANIPYRTWAGPFS